MAEKPNNNGQQSGQWTPEFWLQAFKEGITGLLGLLIVGFTLYLAIRSLGAAGKAEMTDTKDVLTLIMGLTGVVIGYYFGRVPADARAGEAQKQANSAIAESAEVSAQADALADKVGDILDQAPALPSDGQVAKGRSGEPQTESAEAQAHLRVELQGVRDKLRDLAATGRRVR